MNILLTQKQIQMTNKYKILSKKIQVKIKVLFLSNR